LNQRLVLGLIGAALLILVTVLALLYERVPFRLPPGGPKIVELPDLIVDSIAFAAVEPPTGGSPCTGLHTAPFDVTVTIRNVGVTAAVLPTWGIWINVWSVLGGSAPPYRASVGGQPAQIGAGQTATLKATLAGLALVAPDKSQSLVTFAVDIDPDAAIQEIREDNNFRDKEKKFSSELCPAP